MVKTKKLITTFYDENMDIILGLTGRTGSGCTHISQLLQENEFESLDVRFNNDPIEALKDRIVFNYIKDKWKGFRGLSISNIILSLILESGLNKFTVFLDNLCNDNIVIEDIVGLKRQLEQVNNIFEKHVNLGTCSDSDIINYYCEELTQHKEIFYVIFKSHACKQIESTTFEEKYITGVELFSFVMQQIGNNLRSSGECYKSGNGQITNPIIERLCEIIEVIRRHDKVLRICIDSFRNPLEILHFKKKYVNFFTFAIKVDDTTRKKRLENRYNKEQLLFLDKIEYPDSYLHDEEFFYKQNVQKCIELADVHFNNKDNENITSKLVRYIALILHPGLITPTNIERCMQFAYLAKLSSGCLSRQVGAVVTDQSYVIKSVGWNEVPNGQTPCALRNISDLVKENNLQYFSAFESKNESFKNAIREIKNSIDEKNLCGRNYCFCFKDVYNAIEENKNQVHTRSLHAEENAFLGVSKNGGMGIAKGILFVTASPCELCSKKSYQLNLSEIYYIDPYPGIAKEQILEFGSNNQNPQIHLFYGAVGEAYIKLFSQKMAIKDELVFLSGQKVKKIVENMHNPQIDNLPFDAIEFTEIVAEFEFTNRTDIQCKYTFTFVAKKDNISAINRMISWTGNEYLGTKSQSPLCHIEEKINKNASYHQYNIIFDEEIKIGKQYTFTIISNVRDLQMIMRPYFTYLIKNTTKKLILKIIAPNGLLNPATVKSAIFADRAMKQQIQKNDITKISSCKQSKENYTVEFDTPILNYSYGILWKFN